MVAQRTALDRALARHHLSATLRQMIVVAAMAVALIPILYLRGAFDAAFVLVVLWSASPGLLLWLNQPGTLGRRLAARDLSYLRKQARRTCATSMTW